MTESQRFLAARHLLLGEIYNVLGSLKFKVFQRGRAEEAKFNSLIQVLLKVQKSLEKLPINEFLDAQEYLAPFLEVIKSEETSGPITAVALTSMHKFLQCGFLELPGANPAKSIRIIVTAVARCRFKASDADTDELVLYQILHLLLACLTSPVGHFLTNKLVYEITQTCFKMSKQEHLSVILRKAAEMTLMEMVQCIFSNFHGRQVLDNEPIVPEVFVSLPKPLLPLNIKDIDQKLDEDVARQLAEKALPPVVEPTEDVPSESQSLPRTYAAAVTRSLEKPTEVVQEGTKPEEPEPKPAEAEATKDTAKEATEEGEPKPRKRAGSIRETLGADGTEHEGNSDKIASPSLGAASRTQDEENQKPCNSVVLVKLLSFFCGLVNPSKELTSRTRDIDSVRTLGLNLISCFVETKQNTFQESPKFYQFVQDELLRTLLQALLQIKKGDVVILAPLLRILFNILASQSQDLKAQIDVFFTYCMFLLNPSEEDIKKMKGEERITNEQRELLMGVIIQLLKEPSFAVDLFINFDCDVNSTMNIFSDLLDYFQKHSVPLIDKTKPPQQQEDTTLMNLALEGLSTMVRSINDRVKLPQVAELSQPLDVLKQQKYIKDQLQYACTHFSYKNTTPCFEILQDRKLLPVPLDPRSIALFCKNTVFLNKTQLGRYIGEKENLEVLTEYARLFPVTETSTFIECFREYFESFRPFGEAQVIERYIDAFLHHFLSINQTMEMSHDDAFLVCYSIIMLNVDQHSAQLQDKPKMTFEQYVKNLDGDVNSKLLQSVYSSIKEDEIKIHREHLTTQLLSNTWKHLLQESSNLGQRKFFVSGVSASSYDSLLFSNIWRKVLIAIKSLFNSTRDQETLEKTLECFAMCADISSHFKLTQAIDSIIVTLCELSTIPSIGPKRFAVTLGQRNKAQHAALMLFKCVRKHGNEIRESWRNVISCFISFYHGGAIPLADLITWKDNFSFPTENAEAPQEPKSQGFTSWVGSWFGAGSAPQPEVLTDNQKKYQETGHKIIKRCKLPLVIQRTASLNPESLLYLVKVLKSCAVPEAPAPGTKDPHNPEAQQQPIDDTTIFTTKLLTEVILLNKSRILSIWTPIPELIMQIPILFKSPPHFQYVYTSITCAFTLARALLCVAELRPSLLQLVQIFCQMEFNQSFDHQKLKKKIAVGLRVSLTSNLKYFNEPEEWRTVVSLTQWCWNHQCVSDAVELLCAVIEPINKRSSNPSNNNNRGSAQRVYPITFLNLQNLYSFIDLLRKFMTNNGQPHKQDSNVPEKLLKSLFHMIESLPSISSSIPEQELVEKYITPALQYLKDLSCDIKSGVHATALSYLSRALLCPELESLGTTSWVYILQEVVFSLLDNVQREDKTAPMGVSVEVINERRLKVIQGVLGKAFLAHLSKFFESPSFPQIWKKILDYFDTFGQKNLAVTESLKNMLMVIFTSEHFKQNDQFWNESWTRISSFAPELKNDFSSTIAVQGTPL